MDMKKLVQMNEKIAETVTKEYKSIENSVVNGYKRIENNC